MQGILIVDKPAGFTSFDVIAKLRGLCGTRKIGHSGTLDPMATGVLPVFIGKAVKAVDMQARHDKTYEAVMRLGLHTETGDTTGEIQTVVPIPASATESAVREALISFIGTQMQIPPMYSAVKVNGQRLYKAAREGKTVERTPRKITVHRIEVTDRLSQNEYLLRIHCSRGTYIRTLIESIGEKLGTAATMSALRRVMANGYLLDNAYTLDQIQLAKDEGSLEKLLLNVDTVFYDLPSYNVKPEDMQRLLNGAIVYDVDASDGRYRVYCKKQFIRVADAQAGCMRAEKMFVEENA